MEKYSDREWCELMGERNIRAANIARMRRADRREARMFRRIFAVLILIDIMLAAYLWFFVESVTR